MSKTIVPIIARLKTNSFISTNTQYTEGGTVYYRIFGGTRPQQLPTLECIICSEVSETGFQNLDGSTTQSRCKIELNCISATYENAKTLANNARNVLENASYTTSSITVSKARLTASTDTVYDEKGGQKAPTFAVIQIYDVLVSEAM